MKLGKDFGVPIPKGTLRVMLFTSAGLPGFILKLFGVTFLNLSALSVAFVGLFLAPGLASVGIFVLAVIVMDLSGRISHLWNNAVNLRAVEKHVATYGDCSYEFLSNADLHRLYAFTLSCRVVDNVNDVKQFYRQVTRPTPEFEAESAGDSPRQQVTSVVRALFHTVGYRFIVRIRRGPKRLMPEAFATFSSRDFRFVFLPADDLGLTRTRLFCIAHEFGHMNQFVSVASYFKSEGMMRCIIAIPFLACCLALEWIPAAIVLGIFLFYAYLRGVYYPSKLPASYLRDEVTADRAAVWSMYLPLLQQIPDGALRAFVKGDPNLDPSAARDARTRRRSDRQLTEIEAYRYALLKEEIDFRVAGGAPPLAAHLLSPFDRQKRAVAFTGNSWESLMGVGIAVLAFWFYELSPWSLAIGAAFTVGYALIAVALAFLVAARYRAVVRQLTPRLWSAPAPPPDRALAATQK